MTNDFEFKNSPLLQRYLEAVTQIQRQPQTPERDYSFLAKQLIQVTLPHADPGNDKKIWKRTNGNLTLAIQPGIDAVTEQVIGYPYGVIPRLLLHWLTTEAVRRGNRTIELGNSLSDFMHKLSLDSTRGGPRSDAARLHNQLRRLFNATISITVQEQAHSRLQHRRKNMPVSSDYIMWWDKKTSASSQSWQSWVKLSEDFYHLLTSAPVPMDLRALRALRNSSMAIDLYTLMVYKAYIAWAKQIDLFIDWKGLSLQLGTDYTRLRDFKAKVRRMLPRVHSVFPTLKLTILEQEGIVIHPSMPPVTPRKA